MLPTASVVRVGKVYRTLMVDVRPANGKLVDRARRIGAAATDVHSGTAADALESADLEGRTTIAMIGVECDVDEARCRLDVADGVVRAALGGR